MLPWSVNSMAQAALQYLMDHHAEMNTFIEQTKTFVQAEKEQFIHALSPVSNMTIIPTTTSFLLIRLKGNLTAGKLCNRLARDKILIRDCTNFKGLSDRFVRISLKTPEINSLVADKLAQYTVE